MKATKPVFIYLDDSNIYIAAQQVAVEKEGSEVQGRVRLCFENLFELACAGREVGRAYAVGSVPPELDTLWNKLKDAGLRVDLQQRGGLSGGEQGVDQTLQLRMLEDGYDNNPGIVVLLSGDGKGFSQGEGFYATLDRLYKRNWGIEVISWKHSCSRAMREWAEDVGVFVALDEYYDQVTFLTPPRPGESAADPRFAKPIDLASRKTAS